MSKRNKKPGRRLRRPVHKKSAGDDFVRAQKLQREGKLLEAETLLKRILRTVPDSAVVLRCMGMVMFQQGRADEAETFMRRAIAIKDDYAEALNDLGCILAQTKRGGEALTVFAEALELQGDYAEVWFNMAGVQSQQNDFDGAIASYLRAVEFQPNRPAFQNTLGCAYARIEKNDQAVECFRKAIQLDPKILDAYRNLGKMLEKQRKLPEAVSVYQRMIELTPKDPRAHSRLGCALNSLGKYDQAMAKFRQSVAIDPKFAQAHNNIGVVLTNIGKYAEALPHYAKAMELDPKLSNAQLNWGLAMLREGKLEKGWDNFEWRSETPAGKKIKKNRQFDQPRWDGGPLDGKRIFIYWEQGFGDTIHFCRYLPLVAQRGGQVIFECQQSLVGLMKGLDGGAEIIDPQADEPIFDVHCPLLSLPRAFGTTSETIPVDLPYIFPRSADVADWRQRLGVREGLRVGIVWAGTPNTPTDRRRSLPASMFAPLMEIQGTNFYSLQIAERTEELSELDADKIVDLASGIIDFSDTAAAISQLDLVIAVDTAVVHLAGAMGKEVWTLLPFLADWRWQIDRTDSPWYSTMRLFRQEAPEKWDGVLASVGEALREKVAQSDG